MNKSYKSIICNILIIVLLAMMTSVFYSCSGCSRSGVENGRRDNSSNRNTNKRSNSSSNFVNMKKEGGVYRIPITINGVEMYFIFDTGASDISMSSVEATFLYKQGKLNDADILGTQQYLTADGSIVEGTVINLKEVTIGNKTIKNVQASVVKNIDAPLLLGQSALSTFGKVTIDYENSQIVFE